MANDEAGKNKIEVSVGKATDQALGDVIRGLFKRPAEETGGLVADSIGILSDLVRRKRERNAMAGITAIKEKLDKKSVDMKDITPPDEEDLHLLMHGLSLSDDEDIRRFWATMFANAVDPNDDFVIKRPFLTVLENFSPLDAKIFQLIAYAEAPPVGIYAPGIEGARYFSASIRVGSPVHRETLSKTRENSEADVRSLASNLGVSNLSGPEWSSNLLRMGIIEPNPKSPSVRQLDEFDDTTTVAAIDFLHRRVEEIARELQGIRGAYVNTLLPSAPIGRSNELEMRLTNFGFELAKACGALEYVPQH